MIAHGNFFFFAGEISETYTENPRPDERILADVLVAIHMKSKAEVTGQSASRLTGSAISDGFSPIIASPRLSGILLLSLILWEAGILALSSGRKLFWYDELITLHFSTLQPFSRFWQALVSGAEAMPVGYYLIVRLVTLFSGDLHVLLRLPSILGYVLTLLGVYWFARKRLPVTGSMMAVLLVILSPFREYALEARSYSLMVGFLAIAMVIWQRIDENPIMKPLFALFLALSVSTHYFAVLVIPSVAIAELSWTLLSRRIRGGVWAAFLVATIPFFLGFPILLRIRNIYGATFWSKSAWYTVVTTYNGYLGLGSKLALVLILSFAMLVAKLLVHALRGREESARNDFGLPEIVLIGGLCFYPALLVVVTKLIGGGYTTRYGWPALFGMVFALVFLFRTTWVQSYAPQLLGALLLVFLYQARSDVKQLSGPRSPAMYEAWPKFVELTQTETDVPVVIGSPLSFLEAAQYSPPGLRPRLVQLVGAADKGTHLIAQFIPLRFEDLEEFQRAHPKFVLCSGGDLDSVTPYLLEKGYRLTLLSTYGEHFLYAVERV